MMLLQCKKYVECQTLHHSKYINEREKHANLIDIIMNIQYKKIQSKNNL